MNLNATMIIEVVSFLLLLFILTKLLYRPLLSIMDERRRMVKEMVEKTTASEEQARAYAEQTHKALDMAKEEALKIKDEARRLSDKERRKMLEEAKREASFLIEEARKQLESEKDKVVKKIRAEAAGLSLGIASKVIGREINPEDHKRLIEDSITEIEDELSRA